MKKKILCSLVVFMFMAVMSLMLIPKTYAAGFTRDAWIEGNDAEGNPTYNIDKENANVETSGYSPNGYYSPFMLKNNVYSSEQSYVLSATFIGKEDIAPETVDGGVVKMGLVPYYKNCENFFVVYLNWEYGISIDKLANVHINGQSNGQWFDYDLVWIHDNVYSFADLFKVPSNIALGIQMDVIVTSNYIEVVLSRNGERYMVGGYSFDFNLTDGDSCVGLYSYGSSCEVSNFVVDSNICDFTYVLDENYTFVESVVPGLSYTIKDINYAHPLGYDFLGWSTYPDATEPDLYSGDSISINPVDTWVLYPVWDKSVSSYYTFHQYLEYGETRYQEGYNFAKELETKATYASNYRELFNKNIEFIRYSYWDLENDCVDPYYLLDPSDFEILYNLEDMQKYYTKLVESVAVDNGTDAYFETEKLEYGQVEYLKGFAEGEIVGAESVDITKDNQQAIDDYLRENILYTKDQYENMYQSGYNAGVSSIDTESIYSEGYREGSESGYNLGYEEGYNAGYTAGAESVDITVDNEQAIKFYIDANNYRTGDEYIEYGESRYQDGYNHGFIMGAESVDITADNEKAIDEYIKVNNYHSDSEYLENALAKYQEGYDAGYHAGSKTVDITVDNEQAIQDFILNNKYHSDTEYLEYGDAKYQEGYAAGVESVDITEDNEQVIQEYIVNNNYHSHEEYLQYGFAQSTEGYSEGVWSVITGENEQAMQDFISMNKYHSDSEYLEYGELKYQEGINSVDVTIDNELSIQNYIKNNKYHSHPEYLEYGESKYQEGYANAELEVNKPVIDTDPDFDKVELTNEEIMIVVATIVTVLLILIIVICLIVRKSSKKNKKNKYLRRR